MFGLRPIEIFLLEFVIYMLLWLWDDYVATLVSVIFGGVCLLILLVALIVEWIERSKVPMGYYWFMGISVVVPVLVALIFLVLSS